MSIKEMTWKAWVQVTSLIVLSFAVITFVIWQIGNVSISNQEKELEITKEVQEEKTNRGHWLWGRWGLDDGD